MNQINKQSLNLQEEKLKELQRIIPQLFDEKGALDIKELELLSKGYPSSITGKYEFNWAGKMLAKRNAYKPSRANLKPDKARSIDFDSTENLIIEGDNLEVLKLLQKSYSNKVKCIYIDPPYNTGHDFVYTDDFSEDKKAYWEKSGTTENGVKIDSNTESQGRYHSNWLNMMYPRLVLARELLKDEGAIFVSIDDNEVHNLRKVMDEIFGEENFIAQFVWANKEGGGSSDVKHVRVKHEYIVSYSKSLEDLDILGLPISNEERYRLEDEYIDTRGKFYLQKMGMGSIQYSDSLDYSIEAPDGSQIFPANNNSGNKACWRWSKEKFKWGLSNGYIVIKKDSKNIWTVYTKQYRFADNEGNIIDRKQKPFGLIEDFSSTQGAKELKEYFKLSYFNYPKPSSLIRHILSLITVEDDIVLDFFAGSGTTAHAVMELNKEDGGNRKYILVQLPELTDENSEAHKAGFKTISDITIERVKRVSEKIQKEDEVKLLKEGKNLDLGFKVFKLAPSFFPENQFTPDPEKTEAENIKALDEYLEKTKSQMKFEFDEEELLFEILLKDGFKLNFTKELIGEIKGNKVYKVMDGEKDALICLDDSIENSTLKILEGMKDMRFICLERAVDTTKKWNLKSIFGQNLWVA